MTPLEQAEKLLETPDAFQAWLETKRSAIDPVYALETFLREKWPLGNWTVHPENYRWVFTDKYSVRLPEWAHLFVKRPVTLWDALKSIREELGV